MIQVFTTITVELRTVYSALQVNSARSLVFVYRDMVVSDPTDADGVP